MKEESAPNMMPRRRSVIREVCVVLPIIAGLMILIVLLLAATGKFSFDSSSHDGLWPRGGAKFGLYDGPLRGLESYYNPAIELIAFTQFCALLVLPVILIIFKKRLHIPVMPWVLVALFIVLYLLLSTFTQVTTDARYLLDSKLPWLLSSEVIALFGIALSYAVTNRDDRG